MARWFEKQTRYIHFWHRFLEANYGFSQRGPPRLRQIYIVGVTTGALQDLNRLSLIIRV